MRTIQSRKKKPANIPAALPARYSMNMRACDNIRVSVLLMPYAKAIRTFEEWLEKYFNEMHMNQPDEDGRKIEPKAPFRLLNNALLACAPTITHGFEYYQDENYKYFRQMLIVERRPNQETRDNRPSLNDVSRVIRLWLITWAERKWLNTIIHGAGSEPWNQLMQEVTKPCDTQWQDKKTPAEILADNDNLKYEAIPSIIATLLHEEHSSVGPEKFDVVWRRMHDGHKRYCVVSQPIPVEFLKKDARKKGTTQSSGYFSYRVIFELQTQAGRNEPWLYLSLHCTRYAHRPLKYNQRGNDVTILVGANQIRLQDWPRDTTLVRLKATPSVNPRRPEISKWEEDLATLLARIGARPLVSPAEIYKNPRVYWGNTEEDDEYYVLHTEGYSYSGLEGQGNKQAVLAGFSLMERAEVLGGICSDLLSNILIPDIPLIPDGELFSESNRPPSLKHLSDLGPCVPLLKEKEAIGLGIALEDREAHQSASLIALHYELQHKIYNWIHRAISGKHLVIGIFYRHESTFEQLKDMMHSTLRLNPGDGLPQGIEILDFFVPDLAMIQPFTEDASSNPLTVSEWRDAMRLRWEALLRDSFGDCLANDRIVCAAFVELDKKTHTERLALKDIPDWRSIRSVIRDACTRQSVCSQMLVTPKPLTGFKVIDSAQIGKLQNTINDLIVRQMGMIVEDIHPIIKASEIGKIIGNETPLDVIALSFNRSRFGLRYCLATRLRYDGKVDVLLPSGGQGWIPYREASAEVGRVFARARRDVRQRNGRGPRTLDKYIKNDARLSQSDILSFLDQVLINKIDAPSIVIVEAEKWRSSREDGGGWWQLQNLHLPEKINSLILGRSPELLRDHDSNTSEPLDNLLGIIRLRTTEMPQYITNRDHWRYDDTLIMRNYFELTGFTDPNVAEPFHYYSIGKLPSGAGWSQHRRKMPDLYKRVSGEHSGGGIAYRHPGLIEMVPLFVRSDLRNPNGFKALCRIPHLMRSSPSWDMGSLDSPYPLHLGDRLIDDHICILGLGEA